MPLTPSRNPSISTNPIPKSDCPRTMVPGYYIKSVLEKVPIQPQDIENHSTCALQCIMSVADPGGEGGCSNTHLVDIS